MRPTGISSPHAWITGEAEYRRRATDAFTRLLAQIRRDSLSYIFRVEVRASGGDVLPPASSPVSDRLPLGRGGPLG